MKPQFVTTVDEAKTAFISLNKNTPCSKCGAVSKNGSWKIKGKSVEARYADMCSKLNINPQNIKMNLKHTKDVVIPTWNNMCSKISYKFTCATCEQGLKPKSKAIPGIVKKEIKKSNTESEIKVRAKIVPKPKSVEEIKVKTVPSKTKAVPAAVKKDVAKGVPKIASKQKVIPPKKKIIEPSSDDEYEYYDDN